MQRINFVRVMYVTICFVNRCFVKVTIDQHKGKAVNTSPFSQIAILTNYAEVARENELVRSISLIARSLWRYVLRIIRRADVHARYTWYLVAPRLATGDGVDEERGPTRRPSRRRSQQNSVASETTSRVNMKAYATTNATRPAAVATVYVFST